MCHYCSKYRPGQPQNVAVRNVHNKFKRKKLSYEAHCSSCHPKLQPEDMVAGAASTKRVRSTTPTGGVPPEGAAQDVQHVSEEQDMRFAEIREQVDARFAEIREHVDARFDVIGLLGRTLDDKVNTLSETVGAIRASLESIQGMLRATAARLDVMGKAHQEKQSTPPQCAEEQLVARVQSTGRLPQNVEQQPPAQSQSTAEQEELQAITPESVKFLNFADSGIYWSLSMWNKKLSLNKKGEVTDSFARSPYQEARKWVKHFAGKHYKLEEKPADGHCTLHVMNAILDTTMDQLVHMLKTMSAPPYCVAELLELAESKNTPSASEYADTSAAAGLLCALSPRPWLPIVSVICVHAEQTDARMMHVGFTAVTNNDGLGFEIVAAEDLCSDWTQSEWVIVNYGIVHKKGHEQFDVKNANACHIRMTRRHTECLRRCQ